MKHAAFLLGAVLLFTISSAAQGNFRDPRLFAAPDREALIAGLSSDTPAAMVPSSVAPATHAASTPGTLGSGWLSEPAAQVPNISVFPVYKWELHGGYTFFRFFAMPNLKENMNGINVGAVYYPTNLIGLDGDIFGEFGTFLHHSSRFTDYLGGPRFRWLGPHHLEFWAHGLVGYAKFLPQTANGPQTSFSYEGGGGVDFPIARRNLAYRVEADAVGTRLFHTNQVSPKISVGIVLKFGRGQ